LEAQLFAVYRPVGTLAIENYCHHCFSKEQLTDAALLRFIVSRLDTAGAAHSSGNAELWQNPLHQHKVGGNEEDKDQPFRHVTLS
jgi:hypothetical protein